MCFLKHSISAWGKSKSPWHGPWLDLEGVIYLETSHWGRKEKTFWTSGYNDPLSCTKFFEMGSYFRAWFREETQILLKHFYRKLSTIASLACAFREPFKKTSSHTEDEIRKAGNAYQSKIYALHNRQDVPLMRKCKYTAKGKPKQSWGQHCREMQLLSTEFVSAAGREGQGIILKNH